MRQTPMRSALTLLVMIALVTGCASNGPSGKSSGGPTPSASAPGNIDLTATPGDQSLKFNGTYFATIVLPVADINAGATPTQAMNAFLAQYAYYLWTNDPVEQQEVLDLISNKPAVLSQIAAGRAAFRKQTGDQVTQMPVFWDTKQTPVTFTATNTANGTQVKLSGGTLYFSVYDFSNKPSHLKWQDPRGRDVNHRTTITDLSATFGPTAKSGLYTVSFVLNYSLH